MKRLLIASSRNWKGVARLPGTFGPAGFEVHLLDRGDTQASASSWVSARTTVKGSTEVVVSRLLDLAPSFDRTIACDEPLLRALVETADGRADALLPARRDAAAALLDKTLFPALATAAGLRVPRSTVAMTPAEVAAALRTHGGRAMLKGRYGVGGASIRRADDERSAIAAAEELGYPVLVEEWVDGIVSLMPCLFEHGALVAALAAGKVRTDGEFGPSTRNSLRPVGRALLDMAGMAGRAFGLHGFVSFDFFEPAGGGEPVLIEINLRPVPQLHLGGRVGADMADALRDVLAGTFDGTPRTASRRADVMLFPQELHRLGSAHGRAAGTLRWLSSPGALTDVPWNDAPLTLRHLRRAD